MLSIVIPAYNEERSIAFCLDALVHQSTSQVFKVILVDNNSTDHTAQIAREYIKHLDLHIIVEKRKGRGAARGCGFQYAKGDIILSTDSDSIVPPNWIDRMTAPLAKPDIVATTGRCSIRDSSFAVNRLGSIFQPILMHIYRLLYGHYWLSGFSFAIRKSTYTASGGFDPNCNALEDIELGFRVCKQGRITYVPDSPVVMSGRRFQHGIILGLFSYFKQFMIYRLGQDTHLHMDDIR